MRAHSCRFPALVPALGALALSTLALSNTAPAQDASNYYTVQHPAEFKIDWGAFYRQADAKTAEVRKEFPQSSTCPTAQTSNNGSTCTFPRPNRGGPRYFCFFTAADFVKGTALNTAMWPNRSLRAG